MIKKAIKGSGSLSFNDGGGSPVLLEWTEKDDKISLVISLHYKGAYGLGEKYDSLNQKYHKVKNQVIEKFCYQGDKTYCPSPFFWTDTGFGLYAATDVTTTFSFEENEILLELPKDSTIVLFSGTPKEIIKDYIGLFGDCLLPPKWSFGPWISANRWNSQAQAEDQIEKLKVHSFPASVLVLEAWSDEATFYIWNGAKYVPKADGKGFAYEDFDFVGTPWPDPKGMVQRLKEAGIHLVLWQIPVYKKQGPEEIQNKQNDLDREDAIKRKLCVLNSDSSPYEIPPGNWFSGSMIPDYTNGSTIDTWFSKRQYLLDMGVDGFKTDGGEFIYNDSLSFANGSTGAEGKNRYASDYTSAYKSFLGPDRVLFSRAGWAGQHRVPIHWAGDQQSQNSELKSALRAGLSAALTGIPFWGFDIAGFAGPLPSLDLYRRATQLACFCPIMQWHSEPDGGQFKELMPGYEGNNERSPWNIAEIYGKPEFIEEIRYWHWLRMNLMPYIWHTARNCTLKSEPMMRPLIYQWPEDSRFKDCDDSFLFGESLLIAPLLEEDSTSRDVYLPSGSWTNLFDHRVYEGGSTITSGGKGKLPVFIRHGYGIPLNLTEDHSLGTAVSSDYKDNKKLHFILAGEHGQTTFSDEEGNNFIITWDNKEVAIEGTYDLAITWEHV